MLFGVDIVNQDRLASVTVAEFRPELCRKRRVYGSRHGRYGLCNRRALVRSSGMHLPGHWRIHAGLERWSPE